MAQLDVTDIVCDPLFMDFGLIRKRQYQTVGTDGFAINAQSAITFSAVVTNDSGDILTRLAGGERIVGTIVLHTKTNLSDGAGLSESADVVEWEGREYTVSQVMSYSHFGRGFYQAICDLKPVTG